MSMKRREFFKFLAAAPAAVVAPLLNGYKPGTEVSSKDIVIEGNNVFLSGFNVRNAAIQVKGGSSGVRLEGVRVVQDEHD